MAEGTTKEIKCKCVSEYQDKRYGTGMRVHNAKKSTEKSKGGFRCTVCGDSKLPS